MRLSVAGRRNQMQTAGDALCRVAADPEPRMNPRLVNASAVGGSLDSAAKPYGAE